jgi:hypothetical protein
MTDGVNEFLDLAQASVRRLAKDIVELLPAQRLMAFNVAELNFNEAAKATGWNPGRLAMSVALQMGALRALVKKIEAAGGVQGMGVKRLNSK